MTTPYIPPIGSEPCPRQEFIPGDRVIFHADDGNGIIALQGIVRRGNWGRAQNVTIVTLDGRTFVRLAAHVTLTRVGPGYFTPPEGMAR